jgi:hypothetical protein
VNNKRVLLLSLHFEKDADLEKDVKTWAQPERLTHNREGWRKLVGGLYSGEKDKHKKEEAFFLLKWRPYWTFFFYQLVPLQPY